MAILNIPDGEFEPWGIAADLDDRLNLNSLDEEEEKLIRGQQFRHQSNRTSSVGTEFENDIPAAGMLRIQKTPEGILLYTFINENGIQSHEVNVKYLTPEELEELARDNASLWFDVNGKFI